MRRWISNIASFLTTHEPSFLRDILLKRNSRVFAVQALGLALTFGANIFLARVYGETVYGTYSLVSSWAVLLAVGALFGMDDAHLVRIPGFRLNHQFGKTRAQWGWSVKIIGISSAICILVAYGILRSGKAGTLSSHLRDFYLGLVMVISLAYYNNTLSFLRGLDLVLPGEILDKILRPLLFFLLLLLFFFAWPAKGVEPPLLAGNMALAVLCLAGYAMIFPVIHQREASPGSPLEFTLRPNRRYVLLNTMYLLSSRLDILLLGILSVPIAVGHYNVAARLSDVFSYPVAIINLSLPTIIARQKHERGEGQEPGVLPAIAKSSFFQCLVLGLVFLVFGKWILEWYGKGFASAFAPLRILLLATLVAAGTGSIDVFFIMQGQEKKAIYCRLVSLAVSLCCGLLLIPRLGMEGAALAMLSGSILHSAMLEFLFYRQYGFLVHPFHFKWNR